MMKLIDLRPKLASVVILLSLFVAVFMMVVAQRLGARLPTQGYSKSFTELGLSRTQGNLTLSGVNIDLTAEVKFASNGGLYFPQTVSSFRIGGKKITITGKVGEKYKEIADKIRAQVKKRDSDFNLDKLQAILDGAGIQRESWKYHFYGFYYHTKAKEKLRLATHKAQLFYPAIEKYKAAIRQDPAFPMPHLNLAYIYMELGDTNSAAREYQLTAKYNWTYVPRISSPSTDTFGISDVLTDLKTKVDQPASVQFNPENYRKTPRPIRHNEDTQIKNDEDAQNMETFVVSMQKYVSPIEKARLYHNLGYYYATKGAYRMAVLNYDKALKMYGSLNEDQEILNTMYNNIKDAYDKLYWFEAEEFTLTENPFTAFPF
jgi:tetratricopeptide (TPR) repeat protein